MFFSLKKDSRTRGHEVKLVKDQCRLDIRKHSFLKARSCLTNMLCFLEEITKWIDVGSPVDIIYLDFQKAFEWNKLSTDCVTASSVNMFKNR